MSDMRTAIIDSAQRRMQAGGFAGFSFREVAADVGVKSSSVHYYFPAKEDLAAEVIRRWTENTAANVDRKFEKTPDAIKIWTEAFRGTAMSEPHMCPCTVLASSAHDLPDKVAVEVKAFFKMCRDKLVAQGLTAEQASEFLSRITGALVVANALKDASEYDLATGRAPRKRKLAAA